MGKVLLIKESRLAPQSAGLLVAPGKNDFWAEYSSNSARRWAARYSAGSSLQSSAKRTGRIALSQTGEGYGNEPLHNKVWSAGSHTYCWRPAQVEQKKRTSLHRG